MSALLKKAFERVAQEFPDYEQDEFARWLLDAIETDDKRWDIAFSPSDSGANKLDRLVEKALEHFRAGRTELLNPEKL